MSPSTLWIESQYELMNTSTYIWCWVDNVVMCLVSTTIEWTFKNKRHKTRLLNWFHSIQFRFNQNTRIECTTYPSTMNIHIGRYTPVTYNFIYIWNVKGKMYASTFILIELWNYKLQIDIDNVTQYTLCQMSTQLN